MERDHTRGGDVKRALAIRPLPTNIKMQGQKEEEEESKSGEGKDEAGKSSMNTKTDQQKEKEGEKEKDQVRDSTHSESFPMATTFYSTFVFTFFFGCLPCLIS